MIRTIIIEDQNVEPIRLLLQKHKSWIKEVGVARSKEEGKRLIQEKSPDLVLLDIELPNPYDGFDLLQEIDQISFYFIIFSGANNRDYPIQALRLASIDYLSKPIYQHDMDFALNRFQELSAFPDYLAFSQMQVSLLKKNRNLQHQKKWLLFYTRGEGKVLGQKPLNLSLKRQYISTQLQDLIYIKSEGHDLFFYQNHPDRSRQRTVIRGKLSSVEKAVFRYDFIRVHERYLVNKAYIVMYLPTAISPKIKGGSGGVVQLKKTYLTEEILRYEGYLPVSRSAKSVIIDSL